VRWRCLPRSAWTWTTRAVILDLLAGRSLEHFAESGGEGRKRRGKDAGGQAGGGLVGLYFRGLPLGWLTRKGRRLLWSDR
jgi:hypothetical protein